MLFINVIYSGFKNKYIYIYMLCNVGVYIQHIYRTLIGYIFKVYILYILYVYTYIYI